MADPINPASPNPQQQQGSNQSSTQPSPEAIDQTTAAYQRYYELQEKAEKALTDLRKKGAKETLNTLKSEEQAIKKLIDLNAVTLKEGEKYLSKNKGQQALLARYTESAAKNSLDRISHFNLDVQSLLSKTAIGAIGLLILSQIDAQRKLATLAGQTRDIFSKSAETGGTAFGQSYITSISPYIAFISDEMRSKFLQSSLDVGLAIKGISAEKFQNLTDELLVLGNAFNISSGTIVNTLFSFEDILGKTTAEAGADIKHLANTALGLQVAPSRLLELSNNLVSSYKLQKIGLSDVASVFVSYRKNAQLGVEVATELTQRTVGALAGLKEGRIAALLALTSGKGGQELGQSLVSFFKIGGKDVSSRLDLALKAFSQLETRFPSVMKDEFSRTRLVMQTFGITDFETGVQLLAAIESGAKGGEKSADAVQRATEILKGTTGSVQMINNILQNLSGRLFAFIVPILAGLYKYTTVGFSAVKTFFANSEFDGQVMGERVQLMVDRAGVMNRLLDAQSTGNQALQDNAISQLKVLDLSDAKLSGLQQGSKSAAAAASDSVGIFDTMSDHLNKINANTKATALYSKAISAAQEQMIVPVGLSGVRVPTPTALKSYIEAQKQALNVKITLEDTTGTLKAVKTVTSSTNSR